MPRARPARLQHIAGIGVDRMGALADRAGVDMLRLENLDTDIPPTPEALELTRRAVERDASNSYLPFVGQDRLRASAAAHVSALSGQRYTIDQVVISAGGLSGILNTLLATLDTGDGLGHGVHGPGRGRRCRAGQKTGHGRAVRPASRRLARGNSDHRRQDCLI